VTVSADFAGTPTDGSAPLKVTFTNLSTSTGEIGSYRWDFGDGAISVERDPVHVYAQAGGYTVILTVTAGSRSDAAVKTDYITVTPPNESPIITLTTPLEGAVVGSGEVQVTGVVSDDGTVAGVWVNQVTATLTCPGGQCQGVNDAFTATISLEAGNQVIDAVAQDDEGAYGFDGRVVRVDADEVSILLDGVDRTGDATVTPEGYTYGAGPLAERPEPYPVDVYIQDAAGNPASGHYSFTLDLGTWITLTAPSPSDRLNTLTTTVAGEAEAGASVTLAVNGAPAGSTLAGADETYRFDGVDVISGTNTLVVTATDALNHVATALVQVAVNTALPGVAVEAQPNPFSGVTVFHLSASGPDGDPVVSWRLTVRDEAGGLVTQTVGWGEPAGYPVAWDGSRVGGGLADEGDYGYALHVTTTLGITNATGEQRLTIDRSDPAKPGITYPTPGSYFSQPATEVRGTAEPGARVSVFNDGIFWETADADGDGEWSLPRAARVGWGLARHHRHGHRPGGQPQPPIGPGADRPVSGTAPLYRYRDGGTLAGDGRHPGDPARRGARDRARERAGGLGRRQRADG